MVKVYGTRGDNKCKREVIPMGNIVTFEVPVTSLPSGTIKVNWPEELKNKGFSANIIPISVVISDKRSASGVSTWEYFSIMKGISSDLTFFTILNVTDDYFNFQYEFKSGIVSATFYVTFLVTNIHRA